MTWLTHEPLEFLMRRGDHFDDEAERYQRMLQPDNLKRMAAAGVRWGRIFFYKGFGLEYERPNIEKAKQAADIMHQLGMKVALYMAGTMFTETLYHEIPEAKNWEQRDQNDRWVPYGIQTLPALCLSQRAGLPGVFEAHIADRSGRLARRRDIVRQHHAPGRAQVLPLPALHSGIPQFPQAALSDQRGGSAPLRSARRGLDPGERVGLARTGRRPDRAQRPGAPGVGPIPLPVAGKLYERSATTM